MTQPTYLQHTPSPPRSVEALESKHQTKIIELERVAEAPDLLRKIGEQE